MSRKLIYFDVPGYAEAIRYMFHYSGLKFEDFRYQRDKDWSNEVKDAFPYGQLPVYEENGQTINQSMAIARYVASQTGLLPSDPWEQAKLDAAVLNVHDLFKKLASTVNEEEEEKKKALQTEAIAFFSSRFERDLKAGNGYFGGKLSWADFVLVATVVAINNYLKVKVEKDYPAFSALVSEITSLPGVKEYVAKQPYAASVPLYEENGRTLNQSIAIARYVASQTGLLPSDPWEQAKLDAAVLNVYDYLKKLIAFYWSPENKDENRKALDEATPFFLSRFEKELKAGGGHFGGKLSWADFVLVAAVELFNLYLDDSIHKGYPAITALMSEIQALPGVKEYVANRKPYVKPVPPK